MFGFSVNEKVTKSLKKTPYISADNVTAKNYEKFMDLKDVLTKGENEHLNKDTVTGIWYLTDKHFDENQYPQLLIRSSVKAGTKERILLDHEVCVYAENENAYDFDNDIIGDNSFVEGLSKSLRDDILKGKIYAIYDATRE